LISKQQLGLHGALARSSGPTWWQQWSRGRIEQALSAIERGRLEVAYPDGSRADFGSPHAPSGATLAIHDWALFPRVVRGGEIALGEAYVDGLWDSEDVAGLIELFHRNVAVFDARRAAAGPFRRQMQRLAAWSLRNTRRGSRRNIAHHYDLGDDLFERFLDETMSYSSAIFDAPDETLETAQRRKMDAILDLAGVRAGHTVLEIGCGWGSLALAAARRGARVTAITLSKNQREGAIRRVRAAGLAERVAIDLRDYRDQEGRFDRIVSVEMIEAVGHAYLPGFFGACDRLLAPGGRIALQTITVPDRRYEAYRRGSDWLRTYIFPGGLAPSLTALCEAATSGSSLVVDGLRNIGPHYARTLRDWRRRFDARAAELDPRKYDPRFRRLWRYYLAYCEGGFAAGTFGDLQIALTRAEDRGVTGSEP